MTYGKALVVWCCVQPAAFAEPALQKHWRECRTGFVARYLKARTPSTYYLTLALLADLQEPTVQEIAEALH